MDNLKNLVYTELTGTPYSDSDTSITVSDGSVFDDPSNVGEYEITVYNKRKNPGLALNDGEAEIMLLTAVSTNTLTVTRAQGGTSAVALADTVDWAVIQGATKRVFDSIINNYTVDSISSLIDSPTNTKVMVSGFYSDTPWGFTRLFEWDASQAKTGHDGWSIINPDHLSTIGSANWYTAAGDSTPTGTNGCWVRDVGGNANVFEAGAKDTVGYDSTTAFQAIADEIGVINIPDSTNPFEIDAITTTRRTVVNAVDGVANVKLRTPTTANSPGFTLAHDKSGISKGIHIDGDSTSRSCVSISADNCFAFFTAENVTADAGSTVYTSGLEVTGNNCRFDVYAENFSNTGQANGSVPRVVTVQSTADNYSGRVQGLTIQTGLVIGSNTGRGKISELIVENAADNGLYELGGTVDIGEVVYEGNEEGIVVSGKTTIGLYTVHGGAVVGISLNDGTELHIGTYEIVQDGTETFGTAMRTRTASGFGRVHIGSIKGRLRASTLFNCGTGQNAVKSISIDSLNIEYEYDSVVSGSTSRWVDLEAVEEIHISNFHAKIIDINNSLTTETFDFRNNTSYLKPSSLYEPIVRIYDADESTKSSASFGITRTVQDNLDYIEYKGTPRVQSITIGDDSVYTFPDLPSQCVVQAVLVKASVDTVIANFQLAASLPFANIMTQSTTLYEVSTGVPTGTTGTDGKITFFASNAVNGDLHIENREGTSRTLRVFIT